MTGASTTREEVEALANALDATECCVSIGGASGAFPSFNRCGDCPREVANTLRALLDERDEAQTKVKDFARIAYDAAREAAKANIDATALAGLDAMEIQPVLMAVQEWAISTGKARDLLRCWIVGTFTPDMLPQQMRDLGLSDDDDPAECFLAMRYDRDAARAECDAHKARADRYDTEAACASILRAEVERMREALQLLRSAIMNENGMNEGVVTDTLWVSDHETAVDCIDAALAGAPRHE